MQRHQSTVSRRGVAATAVRGLLIAAIAASVGGCNAMTSKDTTGGVPLDYRTRHPIRSEERRVGKECRL